MAKPTPSLASFVERAWGKERAALIMNRKRPAFGSEAHLSELRASLAMTDNMTTRFVNYVLGKRDPLVTWMPTRRAQRTVGRS